MDIHTAPPAVGGTSVVDRAQPPIILDPVRQDFCVCLLSILANLARGLTRGEAKSPAPDLCRCFILTLPRSLHASIAGWLSAAVPRLFSFIHPEMLELWPGRSIVVIGEFHVWRVRIQGLDFAPSLRSFPCVAPVSIGSLYLRPYLHGSTGSLYELVELDDPP